MCFKNKKKDNKKKDVLKEKKKLEKYLVKRNKYKNSKLYLIKKNNFKSEFYIFFGILWYFFIIFISIEVNNIINITDKKSIFETLINIGKYIATVATIVLTITLYIKSEKIKNYDETIKYNPIYLIETSNNKHTIKGYKIKNKQVKIRVLFKENTSTIRNVKVYKYSNDFIIKHINSFSLLNCGDEICDSTITEKLFIVADTFNNERVYTLISGENILHAIDSSNNVYPDLKSTKLYLQDPIDKINFFYMEESIKELLCNNNFK